MKMEEVRKIRPDRIPAFPSKKLILMCFNKYRKGHHYLDDVIELRSLVLPVAKVFLNNTQKFKKLWEYSITSNSNEENDILDDLMEKFCVKADGLLSGQDGHWTRYLRERIVELEKAKKDFDILFAIDRIFNYAHDQGKLLYHMVKGQGRNDEDRLRNFLDTLDTLRDW